jgi:dTDP-4-amino-4,6-dideoxygalactose transaminase
VSAGLLEPVTVADTTVADEELDAVAGVIRSGWLGAGPVTRRFERALADALGTADAVAVNSGTAALHLALLALGVGPGDEVVLPSLSFVAAAAATTLCGARPVFADVTGDDDLTVDPGDVGSRITPRTRVVVAMHYGGHRADIDAMAELARRRGVFLVEDAAHAPAVPGPDGFLGTVGDVGCFSFHAAKNMTAGEGGAVVARDPSILERIRAYRSHAIAAPAPAAEGSDHADWDYDVTGFSLNYRPTDISSAIAAVQLARLGHDQVVRSRLVARYHELLPGTGAIIPFAGERSPAAHHLMAVLLPAGADRAAVRRRLAADGVQTSVHYPPTHLFSAYRDRFGTGPGDLPVTESVATRLLTLPLHARMSEDDVVRVVGVLRGALDRPSS